MWFGRGSDVFSDLAQIVWKKLREISSTCTRQSGSQSQVYLNLPDLNLSKHGPCPPRGSSLVNILEGQGHTNERAPVFYPLRHAIFPTRERENGQGPLNGGVSNWGVSRSGLVLPFLSFFVPFGTFPIFWDFPDLLGDGPGIFPICPFPLSRPIKSTYEATVPKGSATQSGPFPKKVGNTRVWKHPGLASLKMAFLESFSLKMAFSLSRVGKSHVTGRGKSGLTKCLFAGKSGWESWREI